MAAVRTRAIRAMLPDHVGILSLDVFDTLLWRRYPRPVDVFHDIPRAAARAGVKLPPIAGDAFAAARRRAESTARRIAAERFGTGEVTLAQIDEQLAITLGWDVDDPTLLEAMAAAELAAEREAVVADHELLALVVEQLALGRRMVAVSDSYLSPSHIGELLAAAGYPVDAFERTFVSSSYGVSKAAGLFEVIANELDIHPARLLHVGDLPGADVAPPRELGGRSCRWAVARDEAIAMIELESGTDALPVRSSIVDGEPTSADAGVTGLRARLIAPDEMTDAHERLLSGHERFGRLIYGPVLLGFANWVCTRAADLGVDRIYLFEREGRVLADLIGPVADVRGQRLETHVLAVSRSALAPARHPRVDLRYLTDVLQSRRPRRASDVLADIGVDALAGWTGDRLATVADAAELHRLLRDSPARLSMAQGHLDRRRANLHRYVRRAVALDTDHVVVVDLGWAGTIQRSLWSALGELGFVGVTRGLYLATNIGLEPTLTATNRAEGFVANLGTPDGMEPVFRNPEVIEQCCLDRAGTVVGFDDAGAPVRGPDDVPAEQWNEIARLQDGVRACFEEWAAHARPVPHHPTEDVEVWRSVARDILRRFCAAPTRAEVELFRSWRHEDNNGTRSVEQLVPTILEQRGPATAMLVGALEMDELLWASAAMTLNPSRPASPVTVTAALVDGTTGGAVPSITAVGRRADQIVAAYVGGEARQLDALRVAIGTGPSIVTIRRVTVEAQAGDECLVERLTDFHHVRAGRGAKTIAADKVLVRGRVLRLRVPLQSFGQRLAAGQRARVLLELTVENFEPNPNRVQQLLRSRTRSAAQWAVRQGLPAAVEIARSAGAGKVVRDVLGEVRKVTGGRAGGGGDRA